MIRHFPFSAVFAALVFCGLLFPSSALADDEVRVCVELPSGGYQIKTAPLDGTGCPSLATPHEVVGVWVFWTQGVSQFADEYSGRELLGCFDDSEGAITMQLLDTSGGNRGAKRRTYKPGAAPPTGLVDLPDNVAETAAAGQVSWVVANGGNGGQYAVKVDECRTLVGFPPA